MHTYKVELNRVAEFPLDMLRYDDAAAATSDDQALINLMADLSADRSHLPKTVAITLRSPLRFAPHTKRWESFGVRVVESDNPWSRVSAPVRPRTPDFQGRLNHLSIEKRGADAYDILYTAAPTDPFTSGRVARLRAASTEEAQRMLTATRGTWRILWEGDALGMMLPEGLTDREFESAQEAFGVFVLKMLG